MAGAVVGCTQCLGSDFGRARLLLGLYALAAVLNTGIPDSGARYAHQGRRPAQQVRDFWRAQCRLWSDEQGRLSMAVTTLFWGAAAVLQFAVLRWAAEVLHLPLSQGAYLQATVALSIVAGAALAGRWVPLAHATRVLPLGLPVRSLMAGLGLFVGLFMALLMAARWWHRRVQRLQRSRCLLPPAWTGTR